jgi:hypothetical protein
VIRISQTVSLVLVRFAAVLLQDEQGNAFRDGAEQLLALFGRTYIPVRAVVGVAAGKVDLIARNILFD